MAPFEPLAWSKKVSSLNVHAAKPVSRNRLTDNTISVTLPGGDRYVGEVNSEGEKMSGGTYAWANGDEYKGEYKNDKRNGQGTYTWANGDRLDGTWLDDEIVAGTLTIPYSGVLYHDDAGHSHSEQAYQGALQYTGAFAHHMFNGQGLAVWPNTDRYQGSWVNDKMEGPGIYNWASHERFDGHWKNNKMDGTGTMYNSEGVIVMQGTWENDVFKR